MIIKSREYYDHIREERQRGFFNSFMVVNVS